MEFFLNKEDRKIKKIVKKEEKIRLTKEDLKELRKQIEEYGVKEEKTVLALARLQQEDSKYLDTILKKYYKDREIPDRDIQTLCVLVKNGSFREQPAKGYEIKSENYYYILVILAIFLLTVNLIQTSTVAGAIVSLLGCIYTCILSRYIYLYKMHIDNKNALKAEKKEKKNIVKSKEKNNKTAKDNNKKQEDK